LPIRKPSRRQAHLPSLGILCAVAILGLGCWEQVSPNWFPQMKRQAAVQAYELNTFFDSGEGLKPPEGTVPLGDPYPDIAGMGIMEQEQLANPVRANLASLKNGEKLFQRYCSTCHGPEGKGDGPVAGPPFGTGPFGLVLPVGGPASVAKIFSDGHIYTTMTLGRGRMPSYRRILPEHRWDIVNYIRDLNGQGGR
jgi:mono/diheme cytochrome c family protein